MSIFTSKNLGFFFFKIYLTIWSKKDKEIKVSSFMPISLGVLTTKIWENREFRFAYKFSLLSNTVYKETKWFKIAVFELNGAVWQDYFCFLEIFLSGATFGVPLLCFWVEIKMLPDWSKIKQTWNYLKIFCAHVKLNIKIQIRSL